MSKFRINIVLIALFVFVIGLGIMILLYSALHPEAGKETTNQFVLGALIGLLGSAITGLVGLGTTLLSEGEPNQDDRRHRRCGRDRRNRQRDGEQSQAEVTRAEAGQESEDLRTE